MRIAAMLAVLTLLITAIAPLTASAAPAPWSPPRTVYIPETGQSIDGVFLDFWRANNGIANYGYPITPEIEQNGRIVQYYTYARFEYWPEDPNGQVVKLGNLGAELRPMAVQRFTFPTVGVSGKKTDASREMSAFERAWMPVDEQLAAKEPTANWRYVPETGHTVQHGFKALWERTGEAGFLGYPLTEEYVLHGKTYQIFERGQLAWEAGKDPWFVALGPIMAKKYGIPTAPTPQGNLPIYDESLFVKPEPKPGSNGGERWIEVSIGYQYMWVYEGDAVVMESYVSTGRPGFDTPTGTFYVNTKLVSQTMEGVLGGEYYNVPDVPWVMYFTNVGHAIHGAYWHSNFGAVMSHGCINLPVDVAAWLYNFAPMGMRIVITP